MEVGNIEHGLSQKTKDKLHYGTAGFLILSAVVLAFISFFITMTIGTGVIAWGGLSMGTAFGNYENEGEFRQIIAEADNNMYQVKAKRKKNSI